MIHIPFYIKRLNSLLYIHFTLNIYRDDVRDYDFIVILEDYEEYCIEQKLIDNSHFRLRGIVAGKSMSKNVKYNLYYCPDERNFTGHSYIGLYEQKSIKYIGKIKNIVDVLYKDQQLIITKKIFGPVLNQKDKENIINAIVDAKEDFNWDISKNIEFFLVEHFYETDFRKTSPYGLQQTKYFNLNEYIDLNEETSTEEIAHKLKEKKWEL